MKRFIILFLVSLSILACKPITPVLELDTKLITVSAEGEEISVNVKTNTDYVIKISSSHNWIEHSSSSGEEISSDIESMINERFIIKPGDKTKNREGLIVFSDTESTLSDTLIIKQGQLSSIDISQKDLDLDYKSFNFTLNLMTNVEITPSTDSPDWIKFPITNTKSEYLAKQLNVLIEPNSTYEPRMGKIFITSTDGNIGDTLKVIQQGITDLPGFDIYTVGIYQDQNIIYSYDKFDKQLAIVRGEILTNRIYDPFNSSFVSISGVPLDREIRIGEEITLNIISVGINNTPELGQVTTNIVKLEDETIWLTTSSGEMYILKK